MSVNLHYMAHGLIYPGNTLPSEMDVFVNDREGSTVLKRL